jgi:glycolate oxidase
MGVKISSDLIRQFQAIVGLENVLSHPVDLKTYECDGETLDRAIPDLVILPGSTEQVSQVVRLAYENNLPISPRGAGTGLSAGFTCKTGGICLSLTRMNRILLIDSENSCALAQVGVTNIGVSRAAEKFGLYFAPDPSSQIASTIGGNVAENAGGPHTLKYGMTTDHVLGLKVVLADGQIVTIGGTARTGNDLDLTGLIVGSEGTLVVVCEALLKLSRKSEGVETVISYFPTVGSAGEAVSDMVANGVIPAAMEMMDKLTVNAVEDYLSMGLDRTAGALLIVEIDGLQSTLEAQRKIVESYLSKNKCYAFHWAASESDRAQIWKARKTSFGALGRIAPHGYVLDGVIPRSKLTQAIEGIEKIAVKHNLTIANVYHAGDGNLHPCMLYHREQSDEVARVLLAGREILELCVNLGGTLSGEHGIGLEKVGQMNLVFNDDELDLMSELKQSFDGKGLLNQAKLIPRSKSCGESGSRALEKHKLSQISC